MIRQVSKDKQTKDGRKWQYITYYKNYNGERKQKFSQLYLTKKEAEEAERLFLMKRDNPYNKPFSTVASGYFEELKKKSKASTYYTYEKDYNKHIEPYYSKMNIISINVNSIREWAENMEKLGLSVAYLNKIRNILKGIFDYAIRNFGLPLNPVEIYGTFKSKNDEIIKDEDKLRYITYEEFKTFIEVVDNDLWNTFFTFAYYTGCRKGEIQAITWNDIDFDKNIIIINKTLYETRGGTPNINSTKNNLNRKIVMSKTLKEKLADYKKKIKQYSDYNESWFVFGNSTYLKKTTIERTKHKYFELSGVHEITMHEFRHSHVSLLINEYVNTSRSKNMKIDTAKFFLMMSSRMGHTVEVMQKTYMHLFPAIQDEIVDLLDNL